MIDIHTHVIPFVDDGSKSLEDSITMIKNEIDQGVTEIICTPHHIYNRYMKSTEEISRNFNLLNEEIKKQNLPIKLFLGQEICYTTKEDLYGMLERKELFTLKGSDIILLEFSFTHKPEDLGDIIYNFKVKGFRVIIAHVERYDWITVDIVKQFINEGAYIQVNANSILGVEGFKQKHFTKKIIKQGLVDFVASDTHSFRPSRLNEARLKINNDSLFEGIDKIL